MTRPLRRWAPDHRAPLAPDTIRAGYRAHLAATHDGHIGAYCRACGRYLRGIAQAAEQVTISACRTTDGNHEPPNTDTTTAPPAKPTWPHSDTQAPDSAPNASASNAAES